MKRFDTLNMNGANLRGQDLRGCVFDTCNLNGADFTDARLDGARFDTCNLNRATLPSSALTEAHFDTCNMNGVRWVPASPAAQPQRQSVKPEPPTWRGRPSQGAVRPQGVGSKSAATGADDDR